MRGLFHLLGAIRSVNTADLGDKMGNFMETDETLLRRCAEQDQEAWRVLVKRYERLVYSIPIREGLLLDQAADVTQETFAALFRQVGAIREPDRLAGWLMMVARRKTWRLNKAAKVESIEPTDETPELVAEDDFTDRLGESEVIYTAVQSLGEPCTPLIFSLFFDPSEPAYGVIAERLGRPVGSIGPLRGRCLDRLRKELESEDCRAR